MADRTFASLVPRVQASVPGCPYATIVQYIRDAAIRSCERTLYWRYQVPLFNLAPGVSEYPYNVPVDTDVHAMFEAVVNNRPLERLTLERAIELYPQWADLYSGQDPSVAWSTTPSIGTFNVSEYNGVPFNAQSPYVVPDAIVADASTPQSITQVSPDKFVILPLPDGERTYRCRMFVALKPKRAASAMDAVVLDDLEEVIMHGTLQHLLVLPGQTWSDRELAAYHAKQYAYQIGERRARANLGANRGLMRARMQPFGA
jgi:hypothetical protein